MRPAGGAGVGEVSVGAGPGRGDHPADPGHRTHRPARNASTSSAVGIAEEQARREATMAPAALA
ncbi:hypothetical protein TPA0598_04_06530 [Streptomyces lydicamycinicus]|uniref:Uncharacterized protein n=1 Tax=Streptomyces lydicamycinicus TaxID=1546107 RepID=A0A0P4R8Y2_9ACTN|nr:hypothetical protein TPA0598_04_06530 [Streptomyces lydicamycinicus]